MGSTESQFDTLKSLLGNWIDNTINIPACSGLYGRIYQILSILQQEKDLVHWIDFGCLIRNVLCCRASQEGIATLEIPSLSPWPSVQFWYCIGINILSDNNGYFKIEASKWTPCWLTSKEYDIFDEVYKGIKCRPNLEVPSDSSFKAATGFENYSSPGQREAVRALFFMKPGSTLVINLPTGSGKSIVGYMPSLTHPHQGHLTVVIVPTIALAIDQERQFREMKKSNHPLAWHSGLSEEDKKLIKQSIRSGSQPIIFSSPEAICGALRMALYEAAQRGFLRYFIVDETHLVAQWGEEFRPDFQAIAGIRRLLLRVCPNQPFRTVLMSATITDETLQTLETLFDIEGSPQIISAVNLRSEPRYLVHKCQKPEDKKKYIVEVIKHGPRPFLLYVNEPKDAEYWLTELQASGIDRVKCFHGKTKTSDRQQIISEWQKESIDGIVATSAFGVGMDKGDVRMVIHACIPESLDRFYQEVGRGGRDGSPSISITIFDNIDFEKAQGMVTPKIITENLGLSRWKTLVGNAKKANEDDDLLRIDLSIVPPGVNRQSDANRGWNLRTVLLLTRAGIISLDADSPPVMDEDLSEAQREVNVEDYFNHMVIRIKEANHCEEDIWGKLVSQERAHSIDRARRNFDLLKDVVLQRKEIGDVLCQLYRISRPTFKVPVTWRCGSCSICRKGNSGCRPFSPPIVVPLANPVSFINPSWQEHFPMLESDQPIVVLCDDHTLDKNGREFMSVLEVVIKYFSIREVASMQGCILSNNKQFNSLHSKTSDYFIVNTVLGESYKEWSGIPLPLVSILLPWGSDKVFPEEILFMLRPLHIIFAHKDIRYMQNPLRKLSDIYTNILTYKEMKMRLANVDLK